MLTHWHRQISAPTIKPQKEQKKKFFLEMSDDDPIHDSMGSFHLSDLEELPLDSAFDDFFGEKMEGVEAHQPDEASAQADEPDEAVAQAVQQEEAVKEREGTVFGARTVQQDLQADQELLETTRELQKERELSRKYKAELKAATFSHEELFNCLKEMVRLKLFPTFCLVRSTVKESHLVGRKLLVAFPEDHDYKDESRVVFRIKFLVDGVDVEREVPCITLLRTGNAPGIWCFKLLRSEQDPNSFAVVGTLKSKGSRNEKAAARVDARAAAQVAQKEDDGRRQSVGKRGVDGASDHDELDDDAPASKKKKDFCMRLSKLSLSETIGPMEAVYLVGSDGRLRVSKEPVGNVVCATVTSNPKGCHGGSKPLAIHFPDEIENGIDVVLTGRDLVVNLSSVTVKDGSLFLGGFVFGEITDVPAGRDEPPAGFVFARVFGLMDAINSVSATCAA